MRNKLYEFKESHIRKQYRYGLLKPLIKAGKVQPYVMDINPGSTPDMAILRKWIDHFESQKVPYVVTRYKGYKYRKLTLLLWKEMPSPCNKCLYVSYDREVKRGICPRCRKKKTGK